MLLRPSDPFGPYTVLREIGRGGMAVVYEAEHQGLQKRVALKVLNAPADDDARRFLREGVAAARIRHEHIVEVHDTGVRDGTAYLVMELLHGESLGALLRRDGPLSGERVADLLLPVVSALAAAHDVGVVHRDLKPENLFLSRSRHGEVVPKVVDFGLARLMALDDDAQRLTGSSALVGSVAYMSPEQVLNAAPVGPPSDQYAIGVVMYECVTGQLPLLKPSVFATLNAILKGRVARPSSLVSTLDPRLDDLILRAMAREPTARFPDLRALGVALLELATPTAKAAWAREFGRPATPSEHAAPRPRPSPLRAWAVASLLVTLAGGSVWFGSRALRAARSPTLAAPAPSRANSPRAAVAPPHEPPAPPAAAAIPPTPVAPPRPVSAEPARPSPPRRAASTQARRAAPPPAPPPAATPMDPPTAPTTPPPATPWLLRTRY